MKLAVSGSVEYIWSLSYSPSAISSASAASYENDSTYLGPQGTCLLGVGRFSHHCGERSFRSAGDDFSETEGLVVDEVTQNLTSNVKCGSKVP